MSALEIAGLMTATMIVSCVLFLVGQGAIEAHQLASFWILKLSAIFFAVLASLTLTTIWEEWAIWRLSSRPEGAGYFSTVLRTNLYVLLLVFAVPAVLILPERLRSPDFILR
jgi:hypothetical protein